MTIDISMLWYYTFALFVLVMSPGPVVAAVVARVLSRGFSATLPIALAVMIGDFIWVTVALLGVGAIVETYPWLTNGVRYVGAAYLAWLGIREIREAGETFEKANLSKSNAFWPNFTTGLMIILSNPKAILFYMIFVPSFFNIEDFTTVDIGLIGIISAIVPFIGNMIWALAAHFAAKLFSTDKGRKGLRCISGASLILIAVFLLFYK